MVFQHSSNTNSKRRMVPSMASGAASGTANASSRRASARSRSSSRRVAFDAFIENLALAEDICSQIGRRPVEPYQIDLQQGRRVLRRLFDIEPAPAVGFRAF